MGVGVYQAGHRQHFIGLNHFVGASCGSGSIGSLYCHNLPSAGDSARLLQRLKTEKGPIGWFLHQVWDRVRERPLWCSQEAIRNVRNDADVVLYLVNASEEPEDAGYVRCELEILQWMERPVLVLLNQTGPPSRGRTSIDRWREFSAEWPVVADVLPLDAFARSWVDEGVLLQAVGKALPDDKRAAMQALTDAWRERNEGIFDECVGLIVAHALRTAADREPLDRAASSKLEKRRAMTALANRLIARERELWERVIEAHGLEGSAAQAAREHISDFDVSGLPEIDSTKGAVMGGVVSGALSGLAADLLSGGLTFGGGFVAGAILGALGGAGLARGVRLVRLGGEPAVSWSVDFVDRLLQQAVLRYLGIAHFGRGRGEYRDLEQPERWRSAVERAFGRRRDRLKSIWQKAASAEIARDSTERWLRNEVVEVTRSVLENPQVGAVEERRSTPGKAR